MINENVGGIVILIIFFFVLIEELYAHVLHSEVVIVLFICFSPDTEILGFFEIS